MPIARDIRRKYYGPHWYKVVRPPILKRDSYHCRHCGLAQGSVGERSGAHGLFHPVPVRRRHGRKLVTIRLHVCHLNHTPGDNRAENLLSLCPRCHTEYDKGRHQYTRQLKKDGKRPVLTLLAQLLDRGIAAQAAVAVAMLAACNCEHCEEHPEEAYRYAA